MGRHPAGGVGPPERWRGAGAGGALTSGPDPRGAPPDPMLILAPTGGQACGACWSPCGSRGPCPYSLALVQTGIVPSLCRRGNGGSELCGGWCSGPERTLQASDSTSLWVRAPGVTPLHLGCGPPPPGSVSVHPSPPPSLAVPGNHAGERSPVGRAGSPPPSELLRGAPRLMFPASVSSGASPGRLPCAALCPARYL